jgi:hypothetical protein
MWSASWMTPSTPCRRKPRQAARLAASAAAQTTPAGEPTLLQRPLTATLPSLHVVSNILEKEKLK